MSDRAIMEHFQEDREPENPRGWNRFGLETRAIFAILVPVTVAVILGIIALVKLDQLGEDYVDLVARMEEERRKIQSYESLRAAEAAKFDKLREEHVALMAEVREETRKIQTEWSNYENLRAADAAKFEKLRKDHDAFVAEMESKTRKMDADWSEYKILRADEAAKVDAKFTQAARLVQVLIKVATVPDNQRKRARVPRRMIYTALTNSETFSCETNGQPLNSCLWGRTLNGQRQVILVDVQTTQEGERISAAEGIFYIGDGLKDGKCSVRIESVTEQDAGTWSCTLLTQGGAIFRGEVTIATTTRPAYSIYFATNGGGLNVYSLETSSVRTIGDGSDNVFGVAYDSIYDKIYWCSESRIYRSNQDGTELETVSSAITHMQGLSFDWITGNLYVVTDTGNIMACDTNLERPFTCATVLSGQDDAEGLTLDPTEGTMYYTQTKTSPLKSRIVKAGMNGSSPATVIPGLTDAYGIVINYESSRLYWADLGTLKIQSRSLQGGDVRMEVELHDNGPYGLAVLNDTIIWGNFHGFALQQHRSEAGAGIHTLYNGSRSIRHLTIVPPPCNLPTTRTNDCAGQNCSKICVLATSSFSCVS